VNKKWILGLLAGAVLVCIGGAGIVGVVFYFSQKSSSSMVVYNDLKASEAARAIAEFDLPQDCQVDSGFKMQDTSAVIYSCPSDGTSMALFQVQGNDATGEREMQQIVDAVTQKLNRTMQQVEVTRQEEVTVRGFPAQLIMSRGTDSEDTELGQMTLFFQGKGGPAVLMASSNLAVWDSAKMDQIVQSIQ